MEVDDMHQDFDVSETAPQLVQRARRTYGTKKGPQTASNDENGFKAHLSLLSDSLSTHSSMPSSLATSTTTYEPSDLRLELAKIDEDMPLSEDEDDSPSGPAGTKSSNSKISAVLSSPSSPESRTRPFLNGSKTPMRHGNTMPGQTIQYSANTSFASGTSGAVSSPSTDTLSQSKTTSLSRPGPSRHVDSYQDDDDHGPHMSSQSEPPSPQRHLKTLREDTPDKTKASGTRLLPASPWASPVKSFSKATAQIKARAPPKFLGAEDDDDVDMEGSVEPEEPREKDDNAWWSDNSSSGKKRKKKAADDVHAKNKVKKPTKKEIIEAEKETARIRSERDLDVQDKAEFAPLSFNAFFGKKLNLVNSGRVLGKLPLPPIPFAKPTKEDLSTTDPIRAFSSSSPHHNAVADGDEDEDEDDGELDPERVIASNRREAALAETKRQLQQRKLHALKSHASVQEEEDSDLEIVAPEKPTGPPDPLSRLAAATAGKKRPQMFPGGGKKPRIAGGHGSHREMTKDEHNRAMRTKAAAQSTALMAHKKADFLGRGGQLTKQEKATAAKRADMWELLTKAAVPSEEHHEANQEESDEADDESYEAPEEDQETLQGSSPKQPKPTVLVQDSSAYLENSDDEMDDDDENHTAAVSSAQRIVSSDEDDGDHPLAPAPAARRRPQLVISDEEEATAGSDDENLPPNSAVSRSTAFPSGSGFMFPTFTQHSLRTASSPRTPFGELPTFDGKRKGFQGSFSLSPGHPLSPSQQRLTVNLDVSRESSPSKGPLLPAFGEVSIERRSTGSTSSSSPFGFSAIFGGEDAENSMSATRSVTLAGAFKPADFGAISTQLFQTQSSPSQRASPSKRNRPSLENKDTLANLRGNPQDDDFLLSQAGPLGRIAVSTQEAKAIQEAEQKDVVEVLKDTEEERLRRLKEVEVDKEPRWINDAGLFTQTKPAELPWSLTQNLLSQGSFSQSSGGTTSLFPQSGELNAEQLLSQRSPAKSPTRPRRLVRKGELKEAEYSLGEALPETPVKKADAFEALMKPKLMAKTKTEAQIIAHTNFVQGEAEESDDELQLGFSKRRTEEEEEAAIDPEEEAKLVDDTKLSEEQIREEAVVEKHMEHLAEDDAANQRIQEMAIKGQLRKNKRGHGMMEDDSSDDERTARGAKFKKRRVAGIDDLDSLAENTETMPFHHVYIKDLPGVNGTEEEYNEFAHLNKPVDDPATDGDAESDAGSDSEMLSGSESGTKNRISTYDVRQRIRDMGSRGEDLLGEEELQDADQFVDNFMASSDGMLPADYANISEVPFVRRKVTKIHRDGLDILPPSRLIAGPRDEAERQKRATWAKQNEKARDVSARGTASAAVTGHSKAAAARPKNQQSALDKSRVLSGVRPPVRSESTSALGAKLSKTNSGAWE